MSNVSYLQSFLHNYYMFHMVNGSYLEFKGNSELSTHERIPKCSRNSFNLNEKKKQSIKSNLKKVNIF